jgi:cell division protein FtsI (penicillin-binding protein 3)/stage V sporulation protein D (sporulation-specific penicillin-binding protein)
MMRTRIRIISIAILLFSSLLVAKLYTLQIIHADDFAERADRQYQRTSNAFDRGTIYFSDKDGNLISGATLKTGFIIAINPRILQSNNSVDSTYNRIQELLPLDYDDFYMRATKPNDSYEEIKKHVDEEIGSRIADLKIPGVSMFKDKWRYYPGGSLASHVLGFMAFKGDEYGGRYGLEKYYDAVLSRNSDSVYANFFVEVFSDLKKTVKDGQDLEGDLVTTIEPRTQAYLENMIKGIHNQYSSERTGAIIINPQNGEIYAMGMYPTFDPNDLKNVADPAIFSNNLVENVYEMGSIIKPLTMSAGIDLGKVSASTTYNDTGSVSANGSTIYNFDKKGRGVITLQYALSKSLNTGFAYIVNKIGNKSLANYFTNFKLGEKTKIDLPNEATGLIDNLKSPRDIEYITASFGQGIAVSPVEVVRAFSAIANGGKLVTPHIVKDVKYRVGFSKTFSSEPQVQVIKQGTSEQVTKMMVYNVDNSLMDGKAKNPRYSVAAKTGTAQIAERGGYAEDKFLHSFVGYLPANDPKFLVFIYTVNPRGVNYASETLAKPFIEMTKFLINYYQLSPDR